MLAATLAGPLGIENLLGIACFVGVMSLLLLGTQIRSSWPDELTDEEDDEESENEHPAVARGIIHVLSELVRESSAREKE